MRNNPACQVAAAHRSAATSRGLYRQVRRENELLRSLLIRSMRMLNTIAMFIVADGGLAELNTLRRDIAVALDDHDEQRAG